jgi:hypothetical protein
MIVMSPGFGLVLLSGVYCLTAMYNTSSWVVEVALGKPRMCDASNLCSSIRKNWEDIMGVDQAGGDPRSEDDVIRLRTQGYLFVMADDDCARRSCVGRETFF